MFDYFYPSKKIHLFMSSQKRLFLLDAYALIFRGYFAFIKSFIYAFVFGVVAGSFLVFYLYILFFKKKDAKSSFLMNNGNYIIGTITGIVSIVTLFKLIEGYFV